MAKHTAVIFDKINDDFIHNGFLSTSVAINDYDSIMRLSEGTVVITTPHGKTHTVVGTYDSVLEDFRKAAEAPGTFLYIVSRDMVPHLEAHLARSVETEMAWHALKHRMTVSELAQHIKQEMADTARTNLQQLKASSTTWRSELKDG